MNAFVYYALTTVTLIISIYGHAQVPPVIQLNFCMDVSVVNTVLNSSWDGEVCQHDADQKFSYHVKNNRIERWDVFVATFFRATKEGDGSIACECYNISYQEAGLPVLGWVYTRVLYSQNATVQVWQPQGQGNIPPEGEALKYLLVRQSDWNIPYVLSEKFLFEGKYYYKNFTFSNWNGVMPDPSHFEIPETCVSCW